MRVEISGLDSLGVGFPSGSNTNVLTAVTGYSEGQNATEYNGTLSMFYRTSGSSAIAKVLGPNAGPGSSVSSDTNYPFYSATGISVPAAQTSLAFSGGSIVIKLWTNPSSGTPQLVQTINMTFPSASVPVPTWSPLNTATLNAPSAGLADPRAGLYHSLQQAGSTGQGFHVHPTLRVHRPHRSERCRAQHGRRSRHGWHRVGRLPHDFRVGHGAEHVLRGPSFLRQYLRGNDFVDGGFGIRSGRGPRLQHAFRARLAHRGESRKRRPRLVRLREHLQHTLARLRDGRRGGECQPGDHAGTQARVAWSARGSDRSARVQQ